MRHPEQRAMNRMTLIYALIGALCMATIISGVSAFERMLATQEERLIRRAKADEFELRVELLRNLTADRRAKGWSVDDFAGLVPRLNLPPDVQSQLLADARRSADAQGRFDAPAVVRRLAGAARATTAAAAAADAEEMSEVPLYVTAFNLSMLAAALTGFGLLFSRRVKALLVSYRVAKEQAEAAFAEQERFLAIMSHEMRTPLHVIIGSSDLLETTVDGELRTRHVRRIGAASEVLLTLVNDALDLAKASAKTTSIAARPTVIVELVRTTIEMLRAIADKRGLLLGAEIDAHVPDFAALDGERVRQVLLNLLGNALKFTESGGVRLFVTVAAGAAGTASLRFSVEDTGTGIDESKRAELFTPFSPATASRSRNGGTGLGLSISKSLVEQMGGTIDCAVNRKGGSTFWFNLPLVAVAGEAPAADPVLGQNAPPAASARVLAVDDHEDCREVMTQMLTHLGHRVTVAAGGEEALALLRRDQFDLILVDLQMGAMDGAALTAAVRAMPAHAGTPVVGVTATAVASEIEAALAAGMDACIAKPLRLGTLQKNLPEWLARRASGPAAATAAPAADDTPSALDPSTLAELHELNEEIPGFLATRLMNFQTDADQTLTALRAALSEMNRAEVRRLAHRFRTSCGIVGAVKCGALAASIEAEALNADAARLAVDFAKFQRSIHQLRPFIDDLLASVDAQPDPSHRSVA